MTLALALWAGLFGVARASYAEEGDVPFEEPASIRVGGVLDARFVATDDTVSWLDGGLGKLRYGALNGGPASLLRLSQASVVVDADLTDDLFVHVQLNADTETGPRRPAGAVDLIEAFATFEPSLSERVRLRIRAGVFFPPISMEHPGTGWTTRYTVTASAMNSWIGEELRATGAELSVVCDAGDNEFSATAAAFGANDPAGTLIAWRGWSLSDRVSGVSDELPLAPLPQIGTEGFFVRQASWANPGRDVDGRIGYYAGARWENTRVLDVRGAYYDNRADQTALDGQQYAWWTQFSNAGLLLRLPAGIELLGQALNGRTRMGALPDGRDAVDAKYRAAFALASLTAGGHRLSVRRDWFDVRDGDTLGAIDDSTEEGDAWTAAYSVATGEKHRLGVEYLRVESGRPARETLGLRREVAEQMLQVSFRVVF